MSSVYYKVNRYHFFVPKDFGLQEEYDKGFGVAELFNLYSSGVKTHNDSELVSTVPFKSEFQREYSYKPFDYRNIDYNLKKVVRHRYAILKNLLLGQNYAINLMKKQVNSENFSTILLTTYLTDINFYGFQTYTFPLYLYPDAAVQDGLDQTDLPVHDSQDNHAPRVPNLNTEIVSKIEQTLGLRFTPEKTKEEGTIAPIDILDYIYAVLHSPTYRHKYKEFLKIDFPRVPYPSSADTFRQLVAHGGKLRQIHLLQSPVVQQLITSYPVDGSNTVEKVQYTDGRVYINPEQYIENVPQVAWEFYIGGYQPAQKWLKDRKGRQLSFEDILHYQKIIVALTQTERIMKEIDEVMAGLSISS